MNEDKGNGGRKRYDEAFKRSAVELWQRGGRSANRVAAELGGERAKPQAVAAAVCDGAAGGGGSPG